MASKLKKMLVRRLIACVVLTAGAAAFYHPASATTDLNITKPEPSVAGSLSKAHGCWSGEAPADMKGKFPGHVVVTYQGQTVYSATLVGPAMDHTFKNEYPGMVVHAWCR